MQADPSAQVDIPFVSRGSSASRRSYLERQSHGAHHTLNLALFLLGFLGGSGVKASGCCLVAAGTSHCSPSELSSELQGFGETLGIWSCGSWGRPPEPSRACCENRRSSLQPTLSNQAFRAHDENFCLTKSGTSAGSP